MNTVLDKKNYIFVYLLLITILGFSIYANSLNGKFLRDDDFLIKDNTYIKKWSNIPSIFTKNIAAGSERQWFSYRPLQMITYMADYSFWNLNVIGYHLTNILLHILTASVLFWFITVLYNNRILSLLSSILFLIHPIHTEAVSFISGRADPLALLFMLICFILYIKQSYPILMLISYVLALLSRENIIILPILLLLYHYSFGIKMRQSRFLSISIIALIYLGIRLTFLRMLLPHLSISTTLIQRIPGFFVAIANYIRIILLPFNLHMEYGNKIFPFTDPKALLGILILCALLFLALRKKRGNNLLFFSIFWFFIALFPLSNLYPLNAYMAEHWLYIPSIGFSIILAKGLISIHSVRLSLFLSAILITFYSILTIQQNRYWKDPITFYERTLRFTPDDPDVYNNLGAAYNAMGMSEKAIGIFKKAVEINPDCADIHYNLGVAYYNMGKNEEAVREFNEALEITPDDPDLYNNLGAAYYLQGKYEESISIYKKTLEIQPNYAIAHINLAKAYYKKEQFNLAIKHCDKAIELDYTVEEGLLQALKPYRK